jgi:hypothetical protein
MADIFGSDEDVQRVIEQIVRDVPSEIRDADFMGFFEDPAIWSDFSLKSSHPQTIYRDIFSSSLRADAETGGIQELTIRFPAIAADVTDIESVERLLEDINPEGRYRVRVQEQEHTQSGDTEYHPHLHYSRKRRGEIGPPLQDEARALNRAIKGWYSGVGGLFG